MEQGEITIRYLQSYLKKKSSVRNDDSVDPRTCMIKLTEEMGALARMIIRGMPHAADDEHFKDSVEEECFDVLYYVFGMANALDIDLEHWIPIKLAYNEKRYPTGVVFDPKAEK